MAWEITDRFPSWGEEGEFPPTGFFYEGGDQVNEKHLDALWNGIKGLENETRTALEDLDSDGDGKVDAAEEADNADTLNGEEASAFADTNHGNEEHNVNFTTLTEVNNNADVPNADFADNAGDADTLDGNDASDLQSDLSYNFVDTKTAPCDIYFGNATETVVYLEEISSSVNGDFIQIKFNNDSSESYLYGEEGGSETVDSYISLGNQSSDESLSGKLTIKSTNKVTFVDIDTTIIANDDSYVYFPTIIRGSYIGNASSIQINSFENSFDSGSVEVYNLE